jgi:hypothetical protein
MLRYLKRRLLFAAICLLFARLTTGQTNPISLHPENPHYFLYKGKPTILITSGEHYGAVLNLDFNYKKYLDELKSNKFNLTRTFSGAYFEPPGAFNIANNTLAPAADKYLSPWERSDSAGYRKGGNKFDLNKWNAKYFARLKDFLSEAGKRNIIVEFTLFSPFYEDSMWVLSPMHSKNNINGIPEIINTDVHTTDKNGSLLQFQKAFTEKLVKELNSFENVIFEICNEPYFGGVTIEWQHVIADEIINTEKSLPNKHLITQNIANGASIIKDPYPGVSVFNFHYAYPPNAVAYNYHLNKAIGDNETGFRGNSDSTYRFEGWRFILAGGALYNNLDYSFAAGHEEGNFKFPAKQPGGGTDQLRKQLSYLKEFIGQFDFVHMKPDSNVIAGGLPENVVYNALSEEGKQYAFYFNGGNKMNIELNIPSGDYEASWMHPSTGKYEKGIIVRSTSGKAKIKSPGYKEDVALKLKLRSRSSL